MLKKFFNSSHMSKTVLFLTAITFLVYGTGLKAGNEKMNRRGGASGVSVGGYVVATDNKFPNVTLGGTAVVLNSTGKIVLGLDNYAASRNYVVNTGFYLRAVVKISYQNAAGASFSQVERMVINHTSSGVTTDKSIVVIKNAHAVMARILGFEDSAGNPITPSLIPSNIYFEAEVETDRIYSLNQAVVPVLNHNFLSPSNELDVYWNTVSGAEEYELEYTYVNNYSPSSVAYNYYTGGNASISNVANAGLAFTFNNNATRIRTSKNNFRITLNYGQGLLVYRVRTVGRSLANTDVELVGDWTLNQPQTTLSMFLPGGGFNDFYTITTGHEENKNWQASTTFAEDGKKKELVSYYDGSNRKRQTVTRNNSDYVSLVGEIFYDSQGRPAITVLPSPSALSGTSYDPRIKYFEDFNQSNTQAAISGFRPPYNKIDFETSSGGSCPAPAGGMFTGSAGSNANGASLYYSVNNIRKENQNAYIPDAFNYPFTHKVYTPDNTGQVRYESGLGPELKIGNGHETKYVYGDPDQDDLDKLFGSEAGYAEKYKKNMVIDPNGQITVSYLNTENKVVATALAGNAPQNLNQLASLNVYPKSVSYMDYQNGNYTSVNVAADGALTFKKKILPDISGNYTFFYDLTSPQFTDNCIPSFCYDCVYDLEINIKDECNQPVFSKTVNAGTIAGTVNYVCGSPIYFSSTGFTPAFTSYLTAGKEYYLTKVLTINKSAQDAYLTHYMNAANNTCLKDLSYFQNLELANVDYNDCHMTCSACSTKVEQYYLLHNDPAKATIGSGTYDQNYIFMSVVQKQKAIEQCQAPCKPMGLCEAEFKTMLQDMRPMGQYAQYTLTTQNDYSARNFQLSVLNDTNFLRISTVYNAPTQNNGTPFVSYDINTNPSHWRYPEYYNPTTHNFTSPDVNYTGFHYFDNYGNISKIRLVKVPNGGYFPSVVSTAPALIFTDNLGEWTFPENLANLKDFIFAYSNNTQWAYSLVKNHPEFNYFLDCDRFGNPANAFNGKTSDQFDIDLRMANTYAAANTSWGPILGNNPTDLIALDPYFQTPLGSSYYTAFLSRLTNYKGNVGTSIKLICAQMYSSSQMYYSPATCAAAATFGSSSIICNSVTYTIPAASLDAMWKSYRELYLAEKAAFIMEKAHILACNPGSTRNNYFNGAIGDQNFSPYPAYTAYSFFPFFNPYTFGVSPFSLLLGNILMNNITLWPNYVASLNGFSTGNIFHPAIGNGYFDYGSPSSIYHKGKYANKVRRVPDTQTLSNNLAGGATDPATMMTNLSNNVEEDIYFATNQCPLFKRLELFLSSIAKNGSLFQFGGSVPLVSEPSFTKPLYDAIIACAGLSPATWYPLSIQPQLINANNTIKLEFYNGASYLGTSTDILLNNLGNPLAPPDWNNIKMFTNIFFNGLANTGSNFMVKAMYEDLGNTQPYTEMPFSGSTCMISDCNNIADAANGQHCEPTQQALELQNFLSAVVNDVTLSGVNPINLGATGANNSSNYFTMLVRYPFGNQPVTSSPVSHSVTVSNSSGNAQITIAGKDPLLQNIYVTMNFYPLAGALTNLNLVNAVGFGNLTPLQTANTNYDFTIKAYYNTPANPVQTFSVKVLYGYGGGPGCGNSVGGGQCRVYQLKNCEDYAPLQCQNNNSYKTKVQLEALLEEMLDYPLTTTINISNLVNYSNLLQSQIGQNANRAIVRFTTVVNPINGLNDHEIDFCFYSSAPIVDTTCKIRLVYNTPWSAAVITPQLTNMDILDINPVAPLASNFNASVTDISGNPMTITGSAPCLKMQSCETCPTQLVLFEDFEAYGSGMPSSSFAFTTERYDITQSLINPPGPCVYTGYNMCPNLTTMSNVANLGDYSILASTTCLVQSGFADHTPAPNTTKILVSNVWYPVVCPQNLQDLYVIPWQTSSFINTDVGKKYTFSAFFLHFVEICFEIQLIAEDANNNEVIIASKKRNQYGSVNYTYWENITGHYIPTTTTTRFKIKILPTLCRSFQCTSMQAVELYRSIGIDDVSIRKRLCSDPEIVPIAVTDPIEDDCFDQMTNIALTNGSQNYKNYVSEEKRKFIDKYTQKCYQSLERMQASYQSSEGHYTLYYYDQAGNLIKTIPPEGVEPINLSATDPVTSQTYRTRINADRDNKTKSIFTNHRLATRYEYNSLNQMIRQQMPDHANADLYTTTNQSSIPANVAVSGMDFSNASQGYMVGSNPSGPVIYITNNGGTTWNPASSISSADILDIEYSSPTLATAILSDGTLIQANPYNVASPTWNTVAVAGGNSMQFMDIKSDNTTVPATLYISGKNGLLMKSINNGSSWTTINLGTANDLNHLDFKNGWGVVVGNNGTVYYTNFNNFGIWQQFPGINNNLDLQNVSIISSGNGSSTFMNVAVSGVDKNLSPGRGTVLNIRDLNTGSPVITNLYLNPNAVASKVGALTSNVYTSGPNTYNEIFYGGLENTSTPILGRLQSVTPNPNTYANINITPASASEIKDVAVSAPGTQSTARAVSGNGYYYGISTGGSPAASPTSLNSATCNRIGVYGNDGHIVCNGGVLLSYNATTPSAYQTQNNLSMPLVLNAVSAAKDGSGKVYIVGSNGGMLFSTNFGGSWTLANSGVASNLMTVKYIPGSSPKAVIAGSGNFITEHTTTGGYRLTPISTYAPLGAKTYNTISNPVGNANNIFVGGTNTSSSTRVIDTYNSSLVTPVVSAVVSSGAGSIKKMDFTTNGVAYAVGNSGIVMKSTDNGISFTSPPSSPVIPGVSLNEVVVIDAYNAYAFGASNTVLKTTDGVNWISKPTPVGSVINAAYNFGNGNLLAAGGGAPNLFKISDQSNDYASRFFYDALGRLIISQSSKQFNKSIKAYSYTIYDDLGRVIEVGEISGNSPDPAVMAGNINGVVSFAAYTSWLTGGAKSEVTRTVYDLPVVNACGFTQENLRKRVSATYLDTDGNSGNGYSHATFYTYDIHGNVKSLLQENTAMPVGQTCKQIDYKYDLLNGKVVKMSYQSGQMDAWHHKYEYDSDNRINTVYTSKDNLDWTRDAKYFYYLHGPLARAELGNDKVQGLDYAYTLQNWLKGFNSVNLAGTNDIGKDGQAGIGYHPTITDLHKYISDDAVAYALHYYGYTNSGNFINDYRAIEPAKNTSVLRFDGDVSTHPYFTVANSLFNGNIMAMASTIYTSQPTGGPRNPQLATYKYDQLNRINLMQTTTQFAGNIWSAAIPANVNNYRNEFSYDPNGNILSQRRYDNNGVVMDNMTYQYLNNGVGRKLANRLYHINDVVSAGVAATDIDDQGTFNSTGSTINAANNYGYDETGNLVRDNQETISSIDWTVYDKIRSITRTGLSTARNVIFTYDAFGNRTSKVSYTNGQPQSLWESTFYVRDVEGNIMAVYDYKPAGGSGPLTLNLVEHPVYGSSRLGQRTYYDLNNLSVTSPYKTSDPSYTMALQGGNIKYELVNQLENVITVLSDRKIPVPNGSNPNLVDRYIAEILSSTDYYPFGTPMPRRQFNNGTYRYGFNGKENDNEVKGTGNQQDYGMRIYDPRIGKFLSRDPLSAKYPELTPYQFASNRPIDGVDLDGKEFSKQVTVEGGVTKIQITVKVKVSFDGISSDLAKVYKDEAIKQFGGIVGSASSSNVEYSGNLEFDDSGTIGLNTGYSNSDAFVGLSLPGYIDAPIGVKNENGDVTTMYSPQYYGETVVHELLHQGGVEHPTDQSAPADVRLNEEKVGNKFKYHTTDKTTKNILNNVMLDGHINVDGKKVSESRNTSDRTGANKVTPSQLKQVETNIDNNCVNGEPMNDQK